MRIGERYLEINVQNGVSVSRTKAKIRKLFNKNKKLLTLGIVEKWTAGKQIEIFVFEIGSAVLQLSYIS